MGLISIAAVWVSCSARFGGVPADSNADPDAAPVDSGGPPPDAGLGAWGTATAIMGAATSLDEDDVTVSSTTNELIFSVKRSATDKDLYVMKRSSPAASFGAPTALTVLNTVEVIEGSPRLSADDLTLYFARADVIYKSTRTSRTAAWGTPAVVAGVASPARWYTPCGLNRFMVVRSSDLYEGTVGSTPIAVAALNSTSGETSPFLSLDCLTIHFTSSRSGTPKIYTATRQSISAPWTTPVLAPSPINDSGGNDEDPWISADERLFVWASRRNGSTTIDLYMSKR